MKKTLFSFILFILLTGCLKKGSSLSSVRAKKIDSPLGWEACYSEPITLGGKSVQSVSHHLKFTKTLENFYNLSWKFSNHTESNCKGQKSDTGEMIIENTFL